MQLLPPVGHQQLPVRLPGALNRDRRGEGPCRRRADGIEPGLRAVAVDDPHPPVQRLQPVLGHHHRRLPRRQPRLNQAAEMSRVALPPVLLALRRERPGLVGLAQCIRDHGPAQR